MTREPGKECAIGLSEPDRSGPKSLLGAIVECLEDHRAVDLVVIDLEGKSTIADYMVVAGGTSSRQVQALAERLIARLKSRGIRGVAPEGLKQGDWVLIDAGDVIVHLFRPEVRAFYGLEKMWGVSLAEADRSTGAGG